MNPASRAKASTIPTADNPPFVLVHGGRHGGWAWDPVAPLLRSRGHVVFAPSLPGMGDRRHLLAADIDLDAHVADLERLFSAEDIRDAVLVAHSYGGMVACAAMERIHDRVRSLVLLDAHMPLDGESVFDLVGPQAAEVTQARVREEGEGWCVPPSDASVWGLTDPVHIAWVNARTSAQPVKTYEQGVGATAYARSHPYTFIECIPSGLPINEVKWQRSRCASSDYLRHRTIDAPHDAMVVAPEAVAALLLEAVHPPAPMGQTTGAPERGNLSIVDG